MIVRLLGKVALAVGILFVVLVFSPGLPPYDVEFVSHPDESPIHADGPWSKNELLDGRQLLSDSVEGSTLGYLKGAESFATHDGYLYTGVQGGDVLRLSLADPPSARWEFVTKFGEPCGGLHEEARCGRVLGMDIDEKGILVAADAYRGLHRMNLNTGAKEVLVPSDLPIDGKVNTLTNSVAVTKDGKKIYYTTSSTNFGLSDGMYECLAEPSGRALEYDVATNTSKVILTGLSFGNGVALSPNEDFLLVGDTCGKSVWKYHIGGPDPGKSEVIAKMPGFVDNIQPNGKGGFTVGIVITSFPDQPNPVGFLRSRWYLSKFVTRLLVLVQKALKFVNHNVHKNTVFQLLDYKIGNTEYMGADISPLQGLVAEIDGNGQILKTWHGSKVSKICEGFVHDGFMYLGSPYNTYVARVPYV